MFHFGWRKPHQPRIGERRFVSRRVYAFGVLNTVTDVMVSLFGVSEREDADIAAGAHNWIHTDELHVVVPLIAAPRSGGYPW